ncbi:MAG: DNA polymerase III subunit delta [Patescibacteria group bacterium]
MIYFLYGPDTYRSREKLKELVKKNSDGFNIQKIDGSKLSADELNKNISTNDLFSQKKFLIVEGTASKDSKAKEDVVEFLRKLEFDKPSFLIFYDAQVDKRSVIFKVLNKKADESYAFDNLKPAEMDVWLNNQIKEIGLNINNINFKKLAISLGSDTWLAIGELQKLKGYKGSEEVIYEDIDLLVRGKLDDDIFKLTDMIANNNKQAAVKLLRDQIELGSNEMYLLTMIVRQFRILIQLKSVNSMNAAKILKLHPFVVQKSLPMVNKYSMEKLKEIYMKLLDIDLQLKSSKISGEILLEKFILEI